MKLTDYIKTAHDLSRHHVLTGWELTRLVNDEKNWSFAGGVFIACFFIFLIWLLRHAYVGL